MVGRLVSFWDGLFSGAMLVSGSVLPLFGDQIITQLPTPRLPRPPTPNIHNLKTPPRQHCRNSISRATRSAFFRCVEGSFCGSMVVEYWERSSCRWWGSRRQSPQLLALWKREGFKMTQKNQLIGVMEAKKRRIWNNKFSSKFQEDSGTFWDEAKKPSKCGQTNHLNATQKKIGWNLVWLTIQIWSYLANSWALNVDTYPKSSALALNWSHSPQSIGISGCPSFHRSFVMTS